jgi:spermidine/putrescine transport system permease protein
MVENRYSNYFLTNRVALKRFWRRAIQAILYLSPIALFMFLLFVIPSTVLFIYSFLKFKLYTPTNIFTLGNYLKAITDPVYLRVTWNATQIGLLTALLSVGFSYPVAYYVNFRMKKGKNTLLMLIIISLYSSYLVRVYAWKTILGRNGLINGLLITLGIIHDPISFLLYSKTAVLITLLHVFLPFTILPILSSLQNIKYGVIEAAKDLGASPLTTFLKITFPLSSKGVMSAFLYAFVLAAGDYVTPQLVGGTSGTMVGLSIANQFVKTGGWGVGAALSFWVLIVFLVVYLLISYILQSFKLIPKIQKVEEIDYKQGSTERMPEESLIEEFSGDEEPGCEDR